MMLNEILANFYERDLQKLIAEINLFKNEENLWKTEGSVKNSSGNLVLHIIGGSNYFIGSLLAKTGYVRDRNQEFSEKGIPREELVQRIEALRQLTTTTLNSLTPGRMEEEYPIPFDDKMVGVSYVLVQLLAHLNYHLGQVNYLHRILEPQG